MTHSAPADPTPVAEPVLIAHAVTVILGALVTLGWVALPDPTIDTIGTGVWMVVSTVAAIVARGKVTPVDGTTRALRPADFEAYVVGVVRDELAAYPQFRAGR